MLLFQRPLLKFLETNNLKEKIYLSVVLISAEKDSLIEVSYDEVKNSLDERINLFSQQLGSVEELEKKLINAKLDGKLPKIVIPVHFAGQSCDMRKIKSLGDEYGFSIIEDGSHAIGSQYLDKAVGGCQYA